MGSSSFYLCFCHFIKLVHCYLFSNLSFPSFNSSWYSWIIRSLVNGKLVGIHFQTIFERKPSKHVWRQGLSPFGKKLKKKRQGEKKTRSLDLRCKYPFDCEVFPKIGLVYDLYEVLFLLCKLCLQSHLVVTMVGITLEIWPFTLSPSSALPPPPKKSTTKKSQKMFKKEEKANCGDKHTCFLLKKKKKRCFVT